jgi:rubrerythrin
VSPNFYWNGVWENAKNSCINWISRRCALAANVATGQTILKAIKNEIEAREFYLAIAGKVKNPLVRRKFLGLADDELEHRQTLSRLYWAQTGTEVGDLESHEMEIPAPDVANMTLVEALEIAIEAEKDAVENYSRMAEETDDLRTRGFLEYLAEFENAHFETLSRELKKIKDDPDWQDAEVSE